MLKASYVSPVRQAGAAPGLSTGPAMVPQDRGPNKGMSQRPTAFAALPLLGAAHALALDGQVSGYR
jgi:hypothetical protein